MLAFSDKAMGWADGCPIFLIFNYGTGAINYSESPVIMKCPELYAQDLDQFYW